MKKLIAALLLTVSTGAFAQNYNWVGPALAGLLVGVVVNEHSRPHRGYGYVQQPVYIQQPVYVQQPVYLPQPVYMQQPAPVYLPQPSYNQYVNYATPVSYPQSATRYYCPAFNQFYPYVSNCPGQWVLAP